MANPFDQFDAPTETNQTVTGGATANPFDQFDSQSPDGGLQDDLNAQRDAQVNAPDPVVDHYQADPNAPESYNNMYGPILSDPKYAQLNEDHHGIVDSALRHLGSVGIDFEGAGPIPPMSAKVDLGKVADWWSGTPDNSDLQKQQDQELQQKYQSTGQEQPLQPSLHVPFTNTNMTLPEGVAPTVRTQTVNTDNPAYAPDDGGSREKFIPHTYMVDPPTRDAAQRMGYQMLKNIVAGTSDAVTEGKLLTPGTTSKSIPDQVQSGGESLATAVGTLVAGPTIAGKGYKTAVSALADAGPVGSAVAKVAGTFSPSAVQESQRLFKESLKTPGAVKTASAVAAGFGKILVAGSGLMLTEAAVAPDNMQGYAVSPQWFVDEWGMSPERAQDASFMADTPVIAGTLRTFGSALRGIGNVGGQAISGLRNFQFGGKSIGDVLPGMSPETVGLKFFSALDPELRTVPNEQAAVNIKMLGDLISANGMKKLEVTSVSKDVKLDSASAFSDVANQYVEKAYGYRKPLMESKEPGSFDKWASNKADELANRMFEIRTSLSDNTIAKQGINDVNTTLTDASNKVAGGNLQDAQANLGSTANTVQSSIHNSLDSDLVAAQTQKDADNSLQYEPAINYATDKARQETEAAHTNFENTVQQTEAARDSAKTNVSIAQLEADAAKKSANSVISNDPVMGEDLRKARELNPVGTNTKHIEDINNMSEPTYQAYKKVSEEKDAAYQAIADSGAAGDPNSILDIIHGSLKEGEKPTGVLKKIADSVYQDGSFGNIYNNVRKITQDALNTSAGRDPVMGGILRDIRSNINKTQLDSLEKNGDNDVVDLVKNAKQKYNDIVTTFGDSNATRTIEDAALTRMHKEKFDAGYGPGQGVNDFKNTFQNQIVHHLDGADQGRMIEALDKGVKLAGGDLKGPYVNSLIAKGHANLAEKLDTGSKENLSTLNSSLGSTISALEAVDKTNPLINTYKRIKTNLETQQATLAEKEAVLNDAKTAASDTDLSVKDQLGSAKDQLKQNKEGIMNRLGQTKEQIANAQKDADAKFNTIKFQIQDAKKQADKSLLNDFIYKSSDYGPRGKNPGEVGKTIDTILNSGTSTSQLQDLWKKAKDLGPQGDVIKDAIKGTTIAHIRDGMKSGSSLGIIEAADGTVQVNRQNIPKAEKYFNGKPMEDLKVIFQDDPKAIEQLAEAKDIMKKLSIKTPSKFGEKSTLTRTTREDNPEEAVNTAITLVFGVLNPTASKLRKFTAPAAAKSLEAVRSNREGAIEALMTDPAHLGRTAGIVADSLNGIKKPSLMSPLRGVAGTVGESVRPTVRVGSDKLSDWAYGDGKKKSSLKEEMDSVLKDK